MGSVVIAPRLYITGSIAVGHGLSCSVACGMFPAEVVQWHVASSQMRHQTRVSHIGRQILYH